MKKLSKDYSSIDNTVEAYASFSTECDCSCDCGDTIDAVLFGSLYGIQFNTRVG